MFIIASFVMENLTPVALPEKIDAGNDGLPEERFDTPVVKKIAQFDILTNDPEKFGTPFRIILWPLVPPKELSPNCQ